MKGYTTIEQSKKLLSLRTDPSTADMYYCMWRKPSLFVGSYKRANFINGDNKAVPAWSLTALLELMPKTIEVQGVKFYLKILCYESDWYIDYASLEQSYLYSNQSKSLLDVSILIIEQLIQEGHIKVNK